MTTRRFLIVAVLLAAMIVLALIGLLSSLQSQACPEFQLGVTARIVAGDGFDGRTVRVFQHGWLADGSPVYVVELIDPDPGAPTGGYIAASGCQLRGA